MAITNNLSNSTFTLENVTNFTLEILPILSWKTKNRKLVLLPGCTSGFVAVKIDDGVAGLGPGGTCVGAPRQALTANSSTR